MILKYIIRFFKCQNHKNKELEFFSDATIIDSKPNRILTWLKTFDKLEVLKFYGKFYNFWASHIKGLKYTKSGFSQLLSMIKNWIFEIKSIFLKKGPKRSQMHEICRKLSHVKTKVLLENCWNYKQMITEGVAASPLETALCAFGNQNNQSKQRSTLAPFKKWTLALMCKKVRNDL